MKAYAMVTELAGRARFVKFGVSSDVKGRVVNVQCGCPLRIETVLSMDCGTDYHARVVEAALHLEHSDSHASGEWFRFPSGRSAKAAAKEALRLTGERIFAHAVVVEIEVAESVRPRFYRGKSTKVVRGYEPIVGDRQISHVKVLTRRKLLKEHA